MYIVWNDSWSPVTNSLETPPSVSTPALTDAEANAGKRAESSHPSQENSTTKNTGYGELTVGWVGWSDVPLPTFRSIVVRGGLVKSAPEGDSLKRLPHSFWPLPSRRLAVP